MRIEIDGKLSNRYSIKEDNLLKIETAIGDIIIEIKNGKVKVLKASCKNKICVRQGWISRVGEQIICIPSKVAIIIEGEKAEFDAVTR